MPESNMLFIICYWRRSFYFYTSKCFNNLEFYYSILNIRFIALSLKILLWKFERLWWHFMECCFLFKNLLFIPIFPLSTGKKELRAQGEKASFLLIRYVLSSMNSPFLFLTKNVHNQGPSSRESELCRQLQHKLKRI